jgi:hypothetical protein
MKLLIWFYFKYRFSNCLQFNITILKIYIINMIIYINHYFMHGVLEQYEYYEQDDLMPFIK